KVYYRKFFHADPKEHFIDEGEDLLKDVTLFNLIAAFKVALDHMPMHAVHEVSMLNVSVDEQMSFTLDYLRVHGHTTLLNLVSHMTEKMRIIVTVIALLEMAKNKVVSLQTDKGVDDIVIRPFASAMESA